MQQPFAGFPAETITFLKDLKANNNREWFTANKKTYEQSIKLPAQQFCAEMCDRLTGLTGQPHKSKIFRINRDLRFSKDKTPYNTHLHISFMPDRDAPSPPAWFFGLAPGYLTLGTGLFAFDKDILGTYRDRVSSNPGDELEELLVLMTEAGIRLSDPDLKKVPKGYLQDHPHADLLRRKGLAAWCDLSGPAEAGNPALVDRCAEHYTTLKPLFDWLCDLDH